MADALEKSNSRNVSSDTSDADFLSVFQPVAKSIDTLPNHKKTAGEIVFDRSVYTGIGFLLNEFISLVFAERFQRGPGKIIGKEGYTKASRWMTRTFNFKDTVINGARIPAELNAGNSLLWISLCSGGFALLLPMKWLEDHKNSATRKLNHLIDHFRSETLTGEQIRARDEEVEKVIACQPRQTWSSILKGRFTAIAASIGLGTLIGEGGSAHIKQTSDSLLTAVIGGKKRSDTFHHYTRLIGVETVSCLTAAIVLEIASKFFARNKPIPRDPKLCDVVRNQLNNSDTNNKEIPDKSGNYSTRIVNKPDDSYARRAAETPQPQLGL